MAPIDMIVTPVKKVFFRPSFSPKVFASTERLQKYYKMQTNDECGHRAKEAAEHR
jgi:hypothetical protein